MTDRLPIRLAAGSGPTFGVDDLSCAAATHLGLWADEGLDVTWTPVHGGVAAMQAVLDGDVDVSYGGLGPVLRFRAEGNPVRVVVSMARGLAQNLVAQNLGPSLRGAGRFARRFLGARWLRGVEPSHGAPAGPLAGDRGGRNRLARGRSAARTYRPASCRRGRCVVDPGSKRPCPSIRPMATSCTTCWVLPT